MKHYVLLATVSFLPALSSAQLTKDEAKAAVARAGMAAMFPIKAELCGWESGDVTWDTLRSLAASHYLTTSEYRQKLNDQQRMIATDMATAPGYVQLQRSIVQQMLANKPCNDESVPNNRSEWTKYVVTLKAFAREEIKRAEGASATVAPSAK